MDKGTLDFFMDNLTSEQSRADMAARFNVGDVHVALRVKKAYLGYAFSVNKGTPLPNVDPCSTRSNAEHDTSE